MVPEIDELIDCRALRARLPILRSETVPSHERAQGAGRRAAQAHKIKFLLLAIFKDFGEDADFEGGMHAAALATDSDLFPLQIDH